MFKVKLKSDIDQQMQIITETFMDCDEKCHGWTNKRAIFRITKWSDFLNRITRPNMYPLTTRLKLSGETQTARGGPTQTNSNHELDRDPLQFFQLVPRHHLHKVTKKWATIEY